MERVKEEALKLLKSKILWGLMGIFLVFNIFIIISNSYDKNDVNLINKIVDRVGLNLNGEGELKLKKYAEEEKAKAIKLVKEKTNKEEIDLIEILNGIGVEQFSEKEINQIAEAVIIEQYYYTFISNIERYNNLDPLKNAEKYMQSLKVSDFTKNAYLKGFQKFDERLQEIKESGENRYLGINGNYRMHKRLFKSTLQKVGIQAIVLIVIATAFLFNYEFENKTSYIVYSTKKGRGDKDKLLAGLGVGVLFITILLLVTLSVFFIVYDYSSIFNSPINSVFNWETMSPQLSWINVTVGEYLIINSILIYIIAIMVMFITIMMSKIFKNTYITFFACAIIYGVLYILPSIFQFNILTQSIACYTPVAIINNLMYISTMFSNPIPNKYFEVITLFIWSGIVLVGYFIVDKRFKREDL